jgi:pyroglutamyl-peptidase
VEVNPTAALVTALAAEGGGGCRLVAKVLPTEYRRSWTMLRRAVLRHRPDIILHFGFAPKAETVALERFGRLACGAKSDAAGYTPRSGTASRFGPDRLAASIPLDPVAAALREAGFDVAMSEDAGGYLCNATFYRSLQRLGRVRHVGFVHLPGCGPYADSDAYRRMAGVTIQTTLDAVTAVPEPDC